MALASSRNGFAPSGDTSSVAISSSGPGALMVMGTRPEVKTAPAAITAIDMGGLAAELTAALARLPFRRPWRGPAGPVQNTATSLTREVIRSFVGYSAALPINEFRSIEMILDRLCGLVMPPIVGANHVSSEPATVAGVPGIWYRPVAAAEPRSTIVYLHGGGYVGTSPRMYAAFTSAIAARTGSQVFVADYRLAPEFPFPAGAEDAFSVLEAIVESGVPSDQIFLAGDSCGGGLACTVMYGLRHDHRDPIAGIILFSPEVDFSLDQPSVIENAASDILPWNIPTSSYLHGADPTANYLAPLVQDLEDWPTTFVTYGTAEMFRDAIRAFVDRLDDAGIPTTAIAGDDMFHVFPILMPWSTASHGVFDALEHFVTAATTPTDPPGKPHDGSPVDR